MITELVEGLLDRRPEDPWKALNDAGLTALAVPEELGGAGLGLPETAEVLAALGRRAVRTPALVTAIAVLAGRGAGWAEGATLTVALSEPITASSGTAGTRLHGVVLDVPYAGQAHRVIVPARQDGVPGLFLADPAEAAPTARPTSSGSPSARLVFDGVAAARIDTGADLHRIAAACAAAYADGLVRGALELTAKHVAEREQFGRPLVTLQAVAQQLADVSIVSRTLHLAARAACEAGDPDGFADPEVAATLVADDARRAIATCHHLHGGTGLDLSYPLPAYSAAATDLAHLLGDPLDRLADRLEVS